MTHFPVGTRVRSLHTGCKGEEGLIIAVEKNALYPYMIHWENAGWETCDDLEFELVTLKSELAAENVCGKITNYVANKWCCQQSNHVGPCKSA